MKLRVGGPWEVTLDKMLVRVDKKVISWKCTSIPTRATPATCNPIHLANFRNELVEALQR